MAHTSWTTHLCSLALLVAAACNADAEVNADTDVSSGLGPASGPGSGSGADAGSSEGSASTGPNTSAGSTGAGGSEGGSTGPGAEPPEIDPQLLFFDDFEYAVGREDDGSSRVAAFGERGWTHVKSMPAEDGALGFVYTSPTIPGFDGEFPGAESQNVLVLEARPALFGGQTDFYLQLGGPEDEHAGTIPADVWFQFWLYPNHAGEQLSEFRGGKFLYACDDFYPCHSHAWLFLSSSCAASPFMENEATPDPCPFGEVTNGDLFFNLRSADGVSNIDYSGGAPWNADKLGTQDLDGYIPANRWTLVKLHMDTSTENGTWEMWLRGQGENWTKYAEWIGGQTEQFEWIVPPEGRDGHRALRMPTTVGGASGDQLHDYWLYMDDFAMANAESHLPDYADAPG